MDVEFHIASGGTDGNNLSQCGMRGFAENIDGLNDPKDVDAELRKIFHSEGQGSKRQHQWIPHKVSKIFIKEVFFTVTGRRVRNRD